MANKEIIEFDPAVTLTFDTVLVAQVDDGGTELYYKISLNDLLSYFAPRIESSDDTGFYGSLVGLINGVNAIFSTNFKFIDETLKVYFQGQLQTAEQLPNIDGANKTFTLAFAPPVGTEVMVEYTEDKNA